MKNKTFVSGATGFQGAQIAQLLLAQGHDVATLKPVAEEERPALPGLNIVPGDFSDQAALGTALSGVNQAVFTFPLIFDKAQAKELTGNFIKAAETADVSLVVFNTSFDLPQQNTGLLAIDLKRAIKSQFDASNLQVTTLMPDIYIDNLAAPWSIPVIMENNILPYPIGSNQKVPWISHNDLAKYVVSALDKPALAGQTLPIGGNQFTGEEIAAAISQKVGKQINFVGLQPNDFEQQLAPAFGDLAAREISNLYRYVADNRNDLLNKDFAKSQELLSVSPQTVDEWVASVSWNG